MNECRLVIANGQIRFLSQDFIDTKKGQILIHGVEILAEYFQDKDFVDEINRDRKNRREYLTFEVIERAINHVYPQESKSILSSLIELVTFDAIVGNNDRHFYNWGVIGSVLASKDQMVEFSPIYDSARALLWNKTENAVSKMCDHFLKGSDEIDHYVKKSKPRFSFEENTNANHFELIEYLCSYNERYKQIVKNLTTLNKENYVIQKLKEENFCFFSEKRCILIEGILKKRFSKIRNTVT